MRHGFLCVRKILKFKLLLLVLQKDSEKSPLHSRYHRVHQLHINKHIENQVFLPTA